MYKIFILLLFFIFISCERSNNENNESLNNKIDKTQEIPLIKEALINTNRPNHENLSNEEVYRRSFFYTDAIESPDFIEKLIINVSNGKITTDYNVSDIVNVHTSAGDGYWPIGVVTDNYFVYHWDSIRLFFNKDIDINKRMTIIARGGTNEYETVLPELLKLDHYIGYDGYFTEIKFENKPWLNNGENQNKWQIIVKSDEKELINDELTLRFSSLLFNELDSTPFKINNLRGINPNKEYTYRFRTQDTDILVLYIWIEVIQPNIYGSFYRPILYLIPNNEGNFSDIRISLNGTEHNGQLYYIGRYKIDNLPEPERVFPVFESFRVAIE
ncbi:MAG: hypothetical protein FWD47_08725 [Treponema sp.]|nr:hypothetical protein [Treponema sp.]